MKPVSELKGCEKGQDIYVLASGKSLDYIPPSFFDDKVTVGTGNLFSTPYKCKYYVRKEGKGIDHATSHPGIHIVSRHDCGSATGRTNVTANPCYYFDHIGNDALVHPEELDSERIIVSWSTITSSIHIAHYLGAKNIILCGHDCGQIDGKSNLDSYNTSEGGGDCVDPEWYRCWLGQISPASELLANEIRKRGVPVVSINPFINYQMEGHCYEGLR